MRNKKIIRKIIMPAISILIILFSVLTVWVLITPPVLTEEIPRKSFYRSIEYDYKVYPVTSTLYPEGTAPLSPGEAPFYTALTDRIVFTVTAEAVEITNNDLDPKAAEFDITLLLRSPEQWEVEISDFDPPVKVNTPVDGTVEYTSSFALPLATAQQLAEIIAEETEVRPRDGIQLVIQNNLVTHTEAGQSGNLSAEYFFTLKGTTIETAEELSFNDDQLIIDTTNKTNYLNMFGAPVEVTTGRYLFPSFLAFSLLAGGYYVRDHRKNGFSDQDNLKLTRAKLKKRYNSRIIEVNDLKGVVAQKTVLIDVKDMKELIRVADELERPVLQVVTSEEFAENVVRFYVVGEEAIYSYKV